MEYIDTINKITSFIGGPVTIIVVYFGIRTVVIELIKDINMYRKGRIKGGTVSYIHNKTRSNTISCGTINKVGEGRRIQRGS